MGKHLWEIKHAYYCSEGEDSAEYNSWAEHLDGAESMDMDLNLLVRWDWEIDKPSDDPNYRDGILNLYYVAQRKGIIWSSTVQVCRNDEASVRQYLEKCWGKLNEIWMPIGIESEVGDGQSNTSRNRHY